MGGLNVARSYRPDTITNQYVEDAFRNQAASDVFRNQVVADGTVNTNAFTDPGVAANYMNPYQQQVVDVETAEARRQADIAKASRGLGSISRGTFGCGRQALMES